MQLTAAQRELIRTKRDEVNRSKLKHGARGRRRIPGLPSDAERCIAINGVFSKTAGQRCYYRRLEGSDYCGMHRAQHQPVTQLGSAGTDSAASNAEEVTRDADHRRESDPEPRRALLHQERREVKDVQGTQGRAEESERLELKRLGPDFGASRPAGSGHDRGPSEASGVSAGLAGGAGAGLQQQPSRRPGEVSDAVEEQQATTVSGAQEGPQVGQEASLRQGEEKEEVSMTNGRRVTVVGTMIVIQP